VYCAIRIWSGYIQPNASSLYHAQQLP
jgi:hypothetical protein